MIEPFPGIIVSFFIFINTQIYLMQILYFCPDILQYLWKTTEFITGV